MHLKTTIVAVLLLLPFLLAGTSAFAQSKKQPVPQDTVTYEKKNQPMERFVRSADLEVDGLIVDRTITKIGRDFYDIFHRQWEAPADAHNFTILIEEKPTRSNGAYVVVSVNDEPVFEYQLQPRYDVIEEVANYTVAMVYEYLVTDQLNKQLEAEGKKAREVF
ncbi:hypothetical protein H7F15_15720 [Pontibacter sp. Tf4]|uniref:CsgE family curli-type amyloid fiber assembly protein n=1 Tax=Pontibacter sp. Tf4 TaxID=2761620 RepID=UPI001626EFC8|nr:CsgE family curli-type amyloid fiber assembly protein [Pontibacter sp. Tf4]MBB6612493.1 hypothetical protein [Pontibacter sp. Tf4]